MTNMDEHPKSDARSEQDGGGTTPSGKRRYEKPVIHDFLQPAVAFGTGSDFNCGPP